MKVIQVLPSIADESSGPTYYMQRMGAALSALGIDQELHTLQPFPHLVQIPGFPVKAYPRHDRLNLGFSPEMKIGLDVACKSADIMHNNSLWMMPNIYSYWAAKKAKCKIVTSPHGTLSVWALRHGLWKKKIFGHLLQYPALRQTHLFHATCEKEYGEIRSAGYEQPVAIIPIGIDEPVISSQVNRNSLCIRRVIYFGRLHKVKGVARLLWAWKCVAQNGWELVIAGPDCGMLAELKGIVAEGHVPRVSFVGEITGHAKYEFLAGGDVYVLPSDTENFGVTVAEALASGTPVIASQGTPWQGLERERCGRWVPIGVEPLAVALKEMMAMSDEERAAMGARGREWIRRDFSWKGIGAQMKAAYEWLLGQGDRPEWVRVD